MRSVVLFIFLSITPYAIGKTSSEAVTLINSEGKTTKPKDLGIDTSWIGLGISKSNKSACTVIHTELENITIHGNCLSKNDVLNIYYWNKSGVQSHFEIKTTDKLEETSIHKLPIPKKIGESWLSSGNNPRKEGRWFGGFHPDWELVRVYTFEETSKPSTYQFQVNTCKASLKSPVLKKVKPATEEEEEEVLSELKIISKESPYASYAVIEKCHKPFTKSSSGGLITLAKDFSQKLGFVFQNTFEGSPDRDLAETGTLLRYIGADNMETTVPNNPAKIELYQSFSFEKLFPNTERLRF